MAKVGRPNEYKEEYVEAVEDYLAENQDGVKAGKIEVKLPTIEGFALFIGVNKNTMYDWEKQQPAFSNALQKIRTEQQKRLLNQGLAGNYNSTIAKLVLSSNHGMSEKQSIDHTHTVSEEVKEQIDKALDDI